MFFTLFSAGTYVTQVTATDADDPTYGNSARVVYSILHGQPYFSVDPKTGKLLSYLSELWFYDRFKYYISVGNVLEWEDIYLHFVGLQVILEKDCVTHCLNNWVWVFFPSSGIVCSLKKTMSGKAKCTKI